MAVLPEEFHEFWESVVAEARAVPLEFRRSMRRDFEFPGFVIERIQFRSVQDHVVSGWFAFPEGGKRLPGFVWVPPYGRESLLPDEYGTREGFASLSFNLHGEDAFHQEKYTPSRGYFSEGAGRPETWIFRRLFQHCYVAARVLQAQLEVDEERVAAMGMSQGAGMSIWLGAHCPIIRAVAADMPFLGNMLQTLSRTAYRYPLKELVDFMESVPLGREQVLHTVSYFDTVNQASECLVPTQVSYGEKDPAVRPDTAKAIYEALPGTDKRLIAYDWGHDWHPDMVANNRDWLLAHLNG